MSDLCLSFYFIVETSNIGFIASISSMIVIIFVMCGYIVVCAATKLTGAQKLLCKKLVSFLSRIDFIIE